MGTIFSKNNKIKHFASPKNFYDEMSFISSDDDNFLENIDPRSPCSMIARTPVNTNKLHDQADVAPLAQCEYYDTPKKHINPNLKEKLLKKLGYNLKDPRSPSHILSRTPIVLNDREHPVADSSMVPSVEFKEISSNTISFKSELLSVCQELGTSLTEFYSRDGIVTELNSTPKQDPRSPSFGIERTPLVFDRSSYIADDSNDSHLDDEINKMVNELISDIKVYTRKSIEAKENSFRTSSDEIAKGEEVPPTMNLVFEDDITYSTSKVTNTPKSKNSSGTPNRTPLQCLGNKTQSKLNERVKNNNNFRKQIPLNKKNFVYNDENDTPEQTKSISKLTNKSKIPLSSNRIEN